MKRRTFLKIAGALSTEELVRANAAERPYAVLQNGTTEPGLSAGPWILANESQKLIFTQPSGRLEFQSLVRNDQGGWASGSLPGNRLIFGPSFDFQIKSATRSNASGNAALLLSGTSQATQKGGKPIEYSWKAAITQTASSPWFRFDVALHLPEALALKEGAAIEPQIILWLSSNS
ncbi:MAG: hypothetical protein ACRD18_08725, partial [Terriglobia bacterium]